jgi:hypothetical protein
MPACVIYKFIKRTSMGKVYECLNDKLINGTAKLDKNYDENVAPLYELGNGIYHSST